MPAVDDHSNVDIDDVAFLERFRARYSMANDMID
jgi:hypothetical protein